MEAGGLVLVPVHSSVERCPARTVGCVEVVLARCQRSLVVLILLGLPTRCACAAGWVGAECLWWWVRWMPQL